MRSRIRSVILLSVAAFLLILGNRKWWDRISEEREYRNKLRHESNLDVFKENEIDVQQVVFDSSQNRLRNTSIYFQRIYLGLGNPVFSKKRRPSQTVIENGSQPENASESL